MTSSSNAGPAGFASRVLLAVALAAALTLLPTCRQQRGDGGGDSNGAKETTGSVTPGGAGSTEDAAEKVLPSVVNVSTLKAGENPNTGDDTEVPLGAGSGVIIKKDGYVLTNNHVIEGSDEVVVKIDDKDLTAKVVGRDPATDLAVIKIETDGLDAAEIGNPDDLKVGEWLIAVGFPFGLDKTVTAGIVSALGKTTIQPTQNDVTAYTNLIQTDAAINPGNSGGALADLDGQVVGINTLIESQTGQSAGIGFAIPIDFAMEIADQLIENGKAEHAFLGVSIESANPHGIPGKTGGATVEGVESGSPAAKAEIRKGDVIVKIGNKTIETSADVFAAVRSAKPGDKVEIELKRDGKTVTVETTLAARSSS